MTKDDMPTQKNKYIYFAALIGFRFLWTGAAYIVQAYTVCFSFGWGDGKSAGLWGLLCLSGCRHRRCRLSLRKQPYDRQRPCTSLQVYRVTELFAQRPYFYPLYRSSSLPACL